MIRTLVLSFGMAIVAITASFTNVVGQDAQDTAAESQTAHWKGTLNAGGTKLRLEIDITEKDGELTGELRSLDQGNAKLEISEINLKGDGLSFSIPKIGAKFNGTYTKDRTVAEGTFTQGGAKLPLVLSNSDVSDSNVSTPESKPTHELKEAWVGKLQMGVIQPVMQFRIVTLESGETAAFFDSVTEGRTDFAAKWSIEGDKISFDVEKIRLTYRGTLNAARDTAEGTWSQGGRNVPLTLKKQATEFDTVNVWENRPQRPVEPFPYDAQDVTFENKMDNLTLAGTLTIPKAPGKHPAVVLISGSGPQDRDETLMEHKPFLVLADYLTRRGIAVLRYDDRGTAGSTGDFGAATTEDFARDASAAVEFLSSHDRINADQIGLAGHSEGGLIAPMVVGSRDDVAFVVLMAATGVDGVTIVSTQTEAMLRANGVDEATIAMELAVSRAIMEVAVKSQPGEDVSKELDEALESVIQTIPESNREEAGKNIRQAVKGQMNRLQGNWMNFFLKYDPRPALSNIKCPVLAIIGSKDLQVLPDLNMPEIEKALVQGGNEGFEMLELEGLNHLFQKCETGALNEYASIQETFNPQALQSIGDWIIKHTTPVK